MEKDLFFSMIEGLRLWRVTNLEVTTHASILSGIFSRADYIIIELGMARVWMNDEISMAMLLNPYQKEV